MPRGAGLGAEATRGRGSICDEINTQKYVKTFEDRNFCPKKPGVKASERRPFEVLK